MIKLIMEDKNLKVFEVYVNFPNLVIDENTPDKLLNKISKQFKTYPAIISAFPHTHNNEFVLNVVDIDAEQAKLTIKSIMKEMEDYIDG